MLRRYPRVASTEGATSSSTDAQTPTWQMPVRSVGVGTGEPLLVVRGVGKSFGGLRALDDVSLTVRAGTIHALIGPNGCGKTTLLDCLTGYAGAHEGEASFAGERLDVEAKLSQVPFAAVIRADLRDLSNIAAIKKRAAKLAKARCRIYEVGVSYSGRTYEEGKKVNWKDGVRAVYAIVRYNLFA